MGLLGVIIITAIVTIVGGGFAYLIYIKTRPKKETWTAKVFRLSSGTKTRVETAKDGTIISKLETNDLIPYATDVLEKTEQEKGIIIHRLQKLDIITSAVEGDVVDFWGKDKREVSVVVDKGAATLLKKGYDTRVGEVVFSPLSHNRVNILRQEILYKKDRIKKEKDILQAITPWIVAGICMLGLVAICYLMIDGYVAVSANIKDGINTLNAMDKRIMEKELWIEGLRAGTIVPNATLGKQDIPVVQDG